MKSSLILILIQLSPLALFAQSEQHGKTYELDMFSLISFGLAIASIVFAVFAGWFSWELFKKSSSANESTQEAVIRIESQVSGIKNDITEIVQKAVNYWMSDNSANVSSSKTDIDEKLNELTQKIEKISSSNPEAKELEDSLKQILTAQKEEIDKLNSSLLDAKVRTIFPSANVGPAITLEQELHKNSSDEKSGQLIIHINRPIKIATATGKFSRPEFDGEPNLDVKLISTPYESNDAVALTSGIGQHSDFHVHLKIPKGVLKEGEYLIEYIAKTN